MRPTVLLLCLSITCLCLVFSGVEGGKKKREFLAYLIMSLFRKPKKVVIPLPLPIPIPLTIKDKDYDVIHTKKVPYQVPVYQNYESYGGGGYGGGGY